MMRCVAVLSMLILTMACGPAAGPAGSAESAALAGPRWLAERIGAEPVLAETEVVFEIRPDGKVSGSGGCNRYFGSGAVDGARLSLGPFGRTKMACPAPIMAQEDRYLALLASAARYEIGGDGRLMLYADGSEPVLVFRAES